MLLSSSLHHKYQFHPQGSLSIEPVQLVPNQVELKIKIR